MNRYLARRQRLLISLSARLALFVLLLQVLAADHWHSSVDSVVGVENSSAHVQHCHGQADCADAAALFSAVQRPGATLAPPPPRRYGQTAEARSPAETLLVVPARPPRLS